MDDSLNKYREIFISEAVEILGKLNQSLLALEKSPSDQNIINETFRYLHNIKGMAATMGFDKITKLSHELESLMDPVRKNQKQLTGNMINILFKGLDWLETLVGGLEKRLEGGDLNLDPLLDQIKQVLTSDGDAPVKKAEEPKIASIEEFTKPTTLRIDLKILDALINLIGELVISKNRLQDEILEHNDSALNSSFNQTNKIISSLENSILRTRIVPADYIFNRLPRMVRDLSREYKKELTLEVVGKDIGLDRGILEELYEPLIHILRNSIYHGLETAEERKKAEKNPVGKITLSARKEENFVYIEVEDDGAGINIKRVKELALKKGIIKETDLIKYKDKDYFNILTLPGFSTVEVADKTSGRGVGMDVVKTKIESLNGTFSIESKPGSGTKISLKVPLTLAIIQALIVDIYGETYAFPFSIVKEVFSIQESNNGSIIYKGKTIPLVKLKKTLMMNENIKSEMHEALIINHQNKEVGIEISRIKSQHEVVVKPINKTLKPLKVFSGATILGNGQVVLILDPNSILNEAGVK